MGDSKLVMTGEYASIWYVLVVVCLELSSRCWREKSLQCTGFAVGGLECEQAVSRIHVEIWSVVK